MMTWTMLFQILILMLAFILFVICIWAVIDTMKGKAHERKLEEIRTEAHARREP